MGGLAKTNDSNRAEIERMGEKMGKKERATKLISVMVSATLATGMVPAAAFAQEAIESGAQNGDAAPDQSIESVDPTATEIAKATEAESQQGAQQASAADAQEQDSEQDDGVALLLSESAELISEDTVWSEPKTISGNLVIASGVTLTIGAQISVSGNVKILGGGTMKRSSEYGGCLLSVPKGSMLIVKDVSIDGGAIWEGESGSDPAAGAKNIGATADKAAVEVEGSLTLGNRASVSNNARVVGTKESDWIRYQWEEGDETKSRCYAVGGGVSVMGGTLTMEEGSSVAANAISDSDKCGELTSDAVGGGIGLYDGSAFEMGGGSISGNAALTSGSARAMGGGVGVVSHSGTGYAAGKVVVAGGTIEGNKSAASGGGMYLTSDCASADGALSLEASFSGGTVRGNSSAGAGGGVIVWAGTADLSGTNFEGNSSGGNGGGAFFSTYSLITITGGRFANNTANNGGGIAWAGNSFEMTGGLVADNKAKQEGGGLYFYKNKAEAPLATISGATVSGNEAVAKQGGGISAYDVSVELSKAKVSGNSASSLGGGISLKRVSYEQAGLSLLDGAEVVENVAAGSGSSGGGVYSNGFLTIDGGAVDRNVSKGSGGGGGVWYNGAATSKVGEAALSIKNGSVSGNRAEAGSGGGVIIWGGFAEMTGGSVNGNYALRASGGANVSQGSTMRLAGGEISGNMANQGGGVSVSDKSTLVMDGGEVSGNSAVPNSNSPTNNNSGGISVQKGGTFILNNGAVKGNAASYGAGVSGWAANLIQINGGEISFNSAKDLSFDDNGTTYSQYGKYGGGINLGGGSTLELNGGRVVGNSATTDSGGLKTNASETVKASGHPVVYGNVVGGTVSGEGGSYRLEGGSASNVYLPSEDSAIALTGALAPEAVVGVSTAKKLATGTAVRITGAESDTSFYADSAQHFVSDAANAKVQANEEGKYVELAHTDGVQRTVELSLRGAKVVEGAAVAKVDDGGAYSARIEALPGYDLPDSIDGASSYDKDAGKISISGVTEDRTISVTGVLKAPDVAVSGDPELSEGAISKEYDGSGVALEASSEQAAATSFAYQWLKLGENGYEEMEGEDNPSLALGGSVADSGTYKCRVTASDGSQSASAYSNEVRVAISQVEQSISYETGSVSPYVGSTFTNELTKAKVFGAVSYASSNEDVAKVDAATGEVTVVGAGRATVTATAAGSENYGEATASYEVNASYYDPSYPVAIDDSSIEGGSVTASPKNAVPGQKVTLTPKADAGHVLGDLAVRDAKGNELELTDNGDGTFSFKMPAGKVTVEAVFPVMTFPDVDYSQWYAPGVEFMAGKGLMTGYSDTGLFGVGKTLTRGELAAILWRNACPDEAAAYDPAAAKDTTGIAGSADGQFYTAAANWAVANKVITGIVREDGSLDFAATEDVTFEQLVTILARVGATPDEVAAAGSDLSSFLDGSDASAWSAPSLKWAADKSLVQGYDEPAGKRLAPGEDVARERVATVLMRAFELGILK